MRRTFAEVAELFDRFEAMMRTRGMPLDPASHIKGAMDEMKKFLAMKAGAAPTVAERDHDRRIRYMLGAYSLVHAVVQVETSPLFPALVPHLKAIANAPDALVVQNEKSGHPNDQTTNQMFELIVAAPMLTFAEAIRLDHPEKSKGEPDITVQVDGVQWALECKTPWSPDPRAYLGLVRKAIEQLNDAEAARGLVFVSLRNLIRHALLLSQQGQEFPIADPATVLAEEYNRILDAVGEGTGDDVPALFDSPHVARYIFHYGASAGITREEGMSMMTPVQFLWPLALDAEPIAADVRAFYERLVAAMRK